MTRLKKYVFVVTHFHNPSMFKTTFHPHHLSGVYASKYSKLLTVNGSNGSEGGLSSTNKKKRRTVGAR
jgi:hypothetical protein